MDATPLLEADRRRHAEVEHAIGNLKYSVRMNHLPSSRFAANAAWLAVQVTAHARRVRGPRPVYWVTDAGPL